MLDNSNILEQYLTDAEDEGRLTFRVDLPLSTVTTFKIGGAASYGIYPSSIDELSSLCALCRSISVPFYIVGNGSNLVFDDTGYEGAVIFTTAINTVTINENTVYSDCGVSLTHLSSLVAKEGLSGLEFAYGIPGSVGGAVYMNAGAYGGEMKDVVKEVTFYDIKNDEFVTVENDKCAFDYRTSVFQSGDKIILSVKLKLLSDDRELITARMNQYMQSRKDKQPLNYPSAGSVFKRYPGYFTGKLIEEAGLKGYTIGGAQVSEKHAGFIVNIGNATSADLKALIQYIKAVIKENVGIDIECEVKFVPNPAQK